MTSCTSSTDHHNIEEEALLAAEKGEWKKAAELSEQWYRKNPNNAEANYQAATNYLRINFPNKAISILNNFVKNKKELNAVVGKREARLAKAYYMTGQYFKVLEVVKNYSYPKMYRGLAREHLKALIQLGEFETLSQQLDIYQQTGIFRENGKTTNTDFLFRAICNELFLVKNENELKKYVLKFQQWINENEDGNRRRNSPLVAYYLKNYDGAISLLEKSILKEKSPRHLMELQMLLGVCFAKKGIFEKAKMQIEKIHAMEKLPIRHDAFGAKFYHQARIETAIKKKEEAVNSLKKALTQHAEFWSYKFKEDSFLLPLFDEPFFQKLVKEVAN